MSRSAMTATGLLSVGIAARVVQIIPRAAPGHTFIEVWDEGLRTWCAFDPMFETHLERDGACIPGVQALRGSSQWMPANPSMPPHVAANVMFDGTLIYPEPWLYTRVGRQCARWPFRGCFGTVGLSSWKLGPAQRAARAGIALGIITLAISVAAFAQRRKTR